MEKQPVLDLRKQLKRPLSARFDEALVLASAIAPRRRRGRRAACPTSRTCWEWLRWFWKRVAARTMAIAALLHDAAEDQGGEEVLAKICGDLRR